MTVLQYIVSGVISAFVAGILIAMAQKLSGNMEKTVAAFCDRFEKALGKLDEVVDKLFSKVSEEATKREDMDRRLSRLEGSHNSRIEIGIGCHREDRD